MSDADQRWELRVCRSGHVDGYPTEPKTILPPPCIRRAGSYPRTYCGSRTRALDAAEQAAYLLGGEEAVQW